MIVQDVDERNLYENVSFIYEVIHKFKRLQDFSFSLVILYDKYQMSRKPWETSFRRIGPDLMSYVCF